MCGILAAQQTPGPRAWFQGTADAVRQILRYVLDGEPDQVVILSGDQLYRMDFDVVLEEHVRNRADVTICTKPVPRAEAGALGIMQADAQGRIVRFVEKPGDTPGARRTARARFGDRSAISPAWASTSSTPRCCWTCWTTTTMDFGKNIIPAAIENTSVYRHLFDGYWRDIGTIGAFWEANMELAETVRRIQSLRFECPDLHAHALSAAVEDQLLRPEPRAAQRGLHHFRATAS